MLLFHVHFEVQDVPAAEAELERDGFALRARFPYDEQLRLDSWELVAE
jgi:hypothetical protein